MTTAAAPNSDTEKGIDPTDLDLVDDNLEDLTKGRQELWDDIEKSETVGDEAADDVELAAGEANPIDAAAPRPATDSDQGIAADFSENETPTDDEIAADKAADKAAKTVAAAPADKTPTDDVWKGASDAQRAAFDAAGKSIKKLEQSDRSQRGRLGVAQRQINELVKKAGQPATDPAADTAATGAPAPTAEALQTDDWKSFAKEYPEVAGPMEKLISSLTTKVDSQATQLSALGVAAEEATAGVQVELLTETHEDWEEVMATPELVLWLDKQPRHIREAAIRNGEEIVDAEEAADIVGRFKAFRSAQAPANTGDANSELHADTGAETGTQLSGKRQRQLASASNTKTGGPSTATGIPEDGDRAALWKAFDQQDAKAAQRA